MSVNQYAAIFCDDFRLEVNGKFSLIGCYGPDLVVQQFPARLPKLCAFATMSLSIDDPCKSIRVVFLNKQEQLGEITFPEEDLERQFQAEGAKALFINGVVDRQFITFDEPTELHLMAEIDGEEIVLGKLNVRATS